MKPPKPKRIRIYKRKAKKGVSGGADNGDSGPETDLLGGEPADSVSAAEDSAAALSDATPVVSSSKKKRPKVKSSSPSKKKPAKTTITITKKSRRRPLCDDGNNSDMEKTPPPSPTGDEDSIANKRRSGRNTNRYCIKTSATTPFEDAPITKFDIQLTPTNPVLLSFYRKKYVDEVNLSLSDDDTSALLPGDSSPVPNPAEIDYPVDMDTSQSGIKPNFVYVNITDEDTMVVQHILSTRTGTREIESSDDEDEEEKPKEKIELKGFFPFSTSLNLC